MHDLTHLDLFTGIGGFTIAAEAEGFRTIGFADVDKHASRILAERWPAIHNFGDVRRVDAFAGLRTTVLTAGFPCQPWSSAGLGRGTADDRHLWPAARGIIAALRPTWFIGENVSGIISVGLGLVCADLEGLGYSVQPFAIPAGAVGAWHRRERIWFLAHLDGLGKLERQGGGPEIGRRIVDETECLPAGPDRGGREGRNLQEAGRRAVAPDLCRVNWEWPAESPLVRVVYGIPTWLDGLDHRESKAAVILHANQALQSPPQTLCQVWQAYVSAQVLERGTGSSHTFYEEKVLLSYLRRLATECEKERAIKASAQASEKFLRILRGIKAPAGSPYRPESFEQFGGKHPDALQALSRLLARQCADSWALSGGTNAPNRTNRIKGLGNAIVPQVAEPFFGFIRKIEEG